MNEEQKKLVLVLLHKEKNSLQDEIYRFKLCKEFKAASDKEQKLFKILEIIRIFSPNSDFNFT